MKEEFIKVIESKGFKRNPDGSYTKAKANSVAQPAERQPDPIHVPLAEEKRERPDVPFRVVRITSYRRRSCDERNLWDKALTDALVVAGIITDDSTAKAKIEVTQEPVKEYWEERTEVEVLEQENKPIAFIYDCPNCCYPTSWTIERWDGDLIADRIGNGTCPNCREFLEEDRVIEAWKKDNE
jgi:hypothetical protein